MTGRKLALLLICVLSAACRKDGLETVSEPIRHVFLEASSLTVPPGGSAEFAFRPDGALPGEFSLRLRDGGAPEEFFLCGVSESGEPGRVLARISDAGTCAAYSREVCIVYGGAVSDYICVNCGKPSFPASVDTGLPVVFIDTDSGRTVYSKTVEIESVIKIQGAGGYEDLGPCSCRLSGRGNISWKWDKKPYRIEFRDRVPVLGMPAHGQWVLLANYPDRTMMRNLVAMKVSSLTSLAWTPRCVPVELVLNGRHLGNYLLAEQVAVAPERVDVSAQGGFLLESDFHFDNELQWMDAHGFSRRLFGIPFAVKFPSAADIEEDQAEYIKQYVSDAAGAIYSDGFADASEGYARWIDVDSFVDYWLVYEVMGNPELGNPGSVFFHKDAGGKLAAGPCWDFDWCLTRTWTSIEERVGIVNSGAIWYARLFKDPAFARRVRERFMELLPQLQTVPAYIDECGALLAASAELNFALWNPADDRWQNNGLLINGDENLDFADAVSRLRSVFEERLQICFDKLPE